MPKAKIRSGKALGGRYLDAKGLEQENQDAVSQAKHPDFGENIWWK
jgi:hypothetical protein